MIRDSKSVKKYFRLLNNNPLNILVLVNYNSFKYKPMDQRCLGSAHNNALGIFCTKKLKQYILEIIKI